MTWQLPMESLKLCRKSLLENLPTEGLPVLLILQRMKLLPLPLALPVLLFLLLRLPEPLPLPLPVLLFLALRLPEPLPLSLPVLLFLPSSSCFCSCSCSFLYPCQRP